METIREHRRAEFTSRQVLPLDRTDMGTAAKLDPLLKILEENGIIRPIDSAASGRGGRPTCLYAVNPNVLEEVT